MNTNVRRAVAAVLIASIVGTALPVPAHADTVGTDAALAQAQRERIAAVIARPDVQAQLQAYGVDPAEAKARVAALTDEEAAQLAARIGELPAGGKAEAIPLIAMIVFLGAVAVVVIAVGLVAGFVALAKRASQGDRT